MDQPIVLFLLPMLIHWLIGSDFKKIPLIIVNILALCNQNHTELSTPAITLSSIRPLHYLRHSLITFALDMFLVCVGRTVICSHAVHNHIPNLHSSMSKTIQ